MCFTVIQEMFLILEKLKILNVRKIKSLFNSDFKKYF